MKHVDVGYEQHRREHMCRFILVKWCRHCEQQGYRLPNTDTPRSQEEATHWQRRR